MKVLILLLSLIISQYAQSQLTSGGGPNGEVTTIPVEEIIKLNKTYDKILMLANNQWAICSSDKGINFKSISEIYLQLFWKELNESLRPLKCGAELATNKEIECFFDNDKLKQSLKNLLTSKYLKIYFKEFKPDDADLMEDNLNYFISKL